MHKSTDTTERQSPDNFYSIYLARSNLLKISHSGTWQEAAAQRKEQCF